MSGLHGDEGKDRMARTGRSTAFAAMAVAVVTIVCAHQAVYAQGAVARADYVSQLEGVCKPGAEKTQRAMKGARKDIKAERLAIAATKFSKASKIFGSTLSQLKPVPRPEADRKRLSKWFVYLDRQESYLGKIADHLKARRSIAAQRLVARFIHNGNLANRTTLGFEFDYCSFRFSRYG